MDEKDLVIKALGSFAGNLNALELSRKNQFFHLILSYCIDVLKAKRAAYLIYLPDADVLYNKHSLIRKEGSVYTESADSELEKIPISLGDDYRTVFIKDNQVAAADADAVNISRAHDQKLQMQNRHYIFFPVFFQDKFHALVEVCRSESEFSKLEIDFFRCIMNISATLITNMQLYEWAIRDDLTDCYSVSYFHKTLDSVIAEHRRRPGDFAVMMVDLDYFKKINDLYGHQAGDQALVFFADGIRKFIRTSIDTLARYGGDEFCVILKECGLEGAKVVASRVLAYLSETPLSIADIKIIISASIGIAVYHSEINSKDELIKMADEALYKAKDKGRTCFSCYEAPFASK